MSNELTQEAREILLGSDPPVTLTARAGTALTGAREDNTEFVHPDGTVIVRGGRDTNVRWWTWAGYRANITLAASLTNVADPLQRPTDTHIRLREAPREWRNAKAEAADQLCLPAVDERAVNGPKFNTRPPEAPGRGHPRRTTRRPERRSGCVEPAGGTRDGRKVTN